MKLKTTGIIISVVGILYMFFISWISSWWYVPDYRELGFDFISGSSWYTGLTFNIIWSISAPLGAMLVILGFSLFIQVEKKRILFFVSGSIIILFWLAMWFVLSITSGLYGIGGGIIILSFFVSVWSWAKKRPYLKAQNRIVADLRLVSLLFFLISAWGICGLLGSPIFGLRPELMTSFKTQQGAYTLGAKVMICLALGWIFMAISQFFDRNPLKNNIHDN